jgi:chondroitin 4-sulfotransferase 11
MATYLNNPPLVFIHIPKNGGTSVTRWLRDNLNAEKAGIKHGSMQHIELERADYPTFAVVRNPWERLVSLYHFDGVKCKSKIDKGKGKGDYVNQYNNYLKGFDYWLEHGLSYTSNWFTYANNQSDWMPTNPTYLLRFENLLDDFKQIQEYTNCFVPLGHENSTKHKHYTEYYTDATRDLVAELYAQDIARFDYKF